MAIGITFFFMENISQDDEIEENKISHKEKKSCSSFCRCNEIELYLKT